MHEGGGRGHAGWRRAWLLSLWAAAVLLSLPGAFLTVLRLLPWDLGTPWIQLLPLFPASLLLTAAALLAAVLALRRSPRLGRAVLAAMVTAVLLLQLGLVAPRVLHDGGRAASPQAAPSPGRPAGRDVTVMALNVGSTGVDVQALLAEVRARKVDVLALPELGPISLEALESAGLGSVFPFRALDVDWAGTGNGIFSKFPLDASVRVPGSSFYQSRAVATVAGAAGGIHLIAVHVDSPRLGHIPFWRNELRQLGDLRQSLPGSPSAILLGDFNASQDHHEFRDLLGTGLTDAAQAAGKGLAPTWPTGSDIPPFVALDHVLVTPDIGVRGFAVVNVPGTDHAGVLAHLRLPAPS